MNSCLVKIGCIFLIVFLMAGCANNIRMNKGFNDKRPEIKSLAIMPPDIAFVERTSTVTKPKPEALSEISKNIETAITNVLLQGKMAVNPLGISDSLLTADQELALSLTRAKQSFAAACDSVRMVKGKVIFISLDPEIGYFAESANTGYLVFVQGNGYESSTGAQVKDAIFAGFFGTSTQLKGLVLEIGIVDASTGEMLWYNRNKEDDSYYNAKKLSDVEGLCRKLLGKFLQP